MNLDKIIFYGAIGFAVSLVMGVMNRGTSQEVEEDKEGGVELRMNKVYQILGYLSIGIAVVFILTALYYQDEEMYLISGVSVLLFGGLGVPVFMYYKNYRLRFNDEGVVVRNWLGKHSEIKWSEVDQVKFSLFLGCLKMKGENSKVAVHQHLVGLKTFLIKMEEKTKWKMKDLKLPI